MALAQHITGGAPIEEWNTTPSATIMVQKASASDFTHPSNMVWGDIDNDGAADLLYSAVNGPNRIFFNDGQRNLVLSWIEAANTAWTWGAELVDINRDGWLDIVFSNWNDGNPCSTHWPDCGYMLFNNNGSFNNTNTAEWNKTGSSYNMGMGIGDFDGDNDVDIFFAADSDEIFYNDNGQLETNNTWAETPMGIAGALGNSYGYSTTFDAESADFDRDGDCLLYTSDAADE